MTRIDRAKLRRNRRLAATLLLLVPTLWVLGSDLLRRASAIAAFDPLHRKGYIASFAGMLVFWWVLLYAAARRRGILRHAVAGIFVVLFTLAIGVEDAFHAVYNIYLSIDGQLHSKSVPWSVVGTLPISRPIVFGHIGLALASAVALVWAARRWVRPRLWQRRLVPLLVPPLLFAATRLPVSYRRMQSSPFDAIYLHGLTALVKERLGLTHDSPDLRVQRREPEAVRPLGASPARRRNVILIVQESQRFDVTCNAYDPDCDRATRFSNVETPDRMPLDQLRANDSTTAISISNLWSGVRPHESRALLHSVPLMWDFAAAAGYDTGYWTSQNLMFGNARLYVQDITVSHFAVATNLDSQSDLDTGCEDMLASERALHDLAEMREPFFGVVHYSNIHSPYTHYDPEQAPFQPAEDDRRSEKHDEFVNQYKNVVYLSDKAVGHLLRGIRTARFGPRTIVLFTSDHGEAFREHWQLGHTSAIYEEEIHVPGWIDAPEGTLTPSERANITAARSEYVYHLDFAPTMLDLLGIWDAPEFGRFRDRMMGHPLTRRARSLAPMPITNCTWVWECSFRNWGMMLGPMKLSAREWDDEYHCFNVVEDPNEQNDLGESACEPLADMARAQFHTMPDVIPPGRPVIDWKK